MKTYAVKEIYYTIQGEGAHTGRPAVFLRFSGCNLWSGREQDRHKAICKFCDTDFWGIDGSNGGKYEAGALASVVISLWPDKEQKPFVVCTGGEPLLQLDDELIDALHELNFEIAIETNGTIEVPKGVDWVCMSPKFGSECIIRKGNELKLVYPQSGFTPTQFEQLQFEHFYLQPMDGPDIEGNTQTCIEYCRSHPKWRLSIQTHKLIGIP